MKTLFLAIALTLAAAPFVYADSSVPPTPPAAGAEMSEQQSLQNQLSQIGCNAERVAASQEIVRLRKQVADLQASAAKGKVGTK